MKLYLKNIEKVLNLEKHFVNYIILLNKQKK